MTGISLFLTGLLLFSTASEASMNGQIIPGDILDPRITACGVRIDGGEFARLRPFIETSDALAGSFSISITKRSASGTSVSSQSNRFGGGSLGAAVIGVDRPASVAIDMQVNEAGGTALCRVKTDIELDEASMRL